MEKVRLEACTTCSLNQPRLRAVVEKWQAMHADSVEVIRKECLELCQDDCVFRVNGVKLVVPASGAVLLEAKLMSYLPKK